MNNTCVGPCAHDVGCKRDRLASDARGSKFLDKMRPVPNDPNASARMRFYLGEAGTKVFREFHNSCMMKKMRPRIEYCKYSAQRYSSRNSIR
jgi:hypothetical protein